MFNTLKLYTPFPDGPLRIILQYSIGLMTKEVVQLHTYYGGHGNSLELRFEYNNLAKKLEELEKYGKDNGCTEEVEASVREFARTKFEYLSTSVNLVMHLSQRLYAQANVIYSPTAVRELGDVKPESYQKIHAVLFRLQLIAPMEMIAPMEKLTKSDRKKKKKQKRDNPFIALLVKDQIGFESSSGTRFLRRIRAKGTPI